MNPLLKAVVNGDMNVMKDISRVGCSMPLFHYHDMYEIYMLESGERNLFVNENVYTTSKNNVYLLKPYVLHRSEGNTAFEGICLHFSEKYLDRYYSKIFKNQLLQCFGNAVIELSETAAERFSSTAAEMIGKSMEQKAVYLPVLLDLLNSSGKNNVDLRGCMPEIINYINANFTVIKSIDEIAQRFYLSKNYISSLFKQQTGMSFIKYINTLKIQFACYRLSTPDYSIAQIAAESGFESSTYFCRVFRKIMGCSPTQYRNNL